MRSRGAKVLTLQTSHLFSLLLRLMSEISKGQIEVKV